MATEAGRKAIAKYIAKFDDIKIRVPKGARERYKQYADSQKKSLNALIIDLLERDIAEKGGI
jgi:predicted HicB family RNase H-like nuclease